MPRPPLFYDPRTDAIGSRVTGTRVAFGPDADLPTARRLWEEQRACMAAGPELADVLEALKTELHAAERGDIRVGIRRMLDIIERPDIVALLKRCV